jgi:hypothetical protein
MAAAHPADDAFLQQQDFVHMHKVPRELVQTGGFFTTHGATDGSGSYIGQVEGEPDDVDYIKESQGAHANDDDYVEDAPKH